MSQPVTTWLGYWIDGPPCGRVEATSAWGAARRFGEYHTGDLDDWERLPDGTFRRFLMVSEGDAPSVRFEVRAQYQLIFTSHCMGDETT